LLSKRCRDLLFRDIILEKDIITHEMRSKPFKAFGVNIECILEKPLCLMLELGRTCSLFDDDLLHRSQYHHFDESNFNQNFSIILRLCSNKRKINLAVLILPGPELPSAYPLPPSVHHAKFRKSKNKQTSGALILPFARNHVDRVYEMDKINLRLGLIDFSSSRPSSSFFSRLDTRGPSLSEIVVQRSESTENGFEDVQLPDNSTTRVNILRLRPGPIEVIPHSLSSHPLPFRIYRIREL